MITAIPGQIIKILIEGGVDESYDIEIRRKIIVMNIIILMGLITLIPLGMIAFINENLILSFFDLCVAVVLIAVSCSVRITGYHIVYSCLGLSAVGILFIYLFATGGGNNTGHLWYYTFPLLASFLLGSKRGAIMPFVLFSFAILVFLFKDYSPLIIEYPKFFKIRFIFSFFVVSGLSYFFENAKEKGQQQLVMKNEDLVKLVGDLKQSKDEQKKMSLLLETILDGIPDIIGIHTKNRDLVRYNAAGNKFIDPSIEGTTEKKCFHLIGNNGPCDICVSSETYKTKQPACVERYIEEKGMWLDIRTYPLLDEHNEITHVVEHLRDITKEKQAEKALQQSEERYRSLVENTLEGFFICEIPEGQILFLNERACEIHGYTLEEGLQFTIWDMISHKDHKRALNRIKEHLNGVKRSPERRTLTSTHKDGSPIRIELTTSLVTFQDHIALQGVFRDNTKQERLELQLQQSKKMEAIGLLAGGVAHDLNNVLSGIVSYPDLLLMELPKESPLRKPIETIHSSGQKAAEIVQDLLTLARRGVKTKNILNVNNVVSDFLRSAEYEKILSYHPKVSVETNLRNWK